MDIYKEFVIKIDPEIHEEALMDTTRVLSYAPLTSWFRSMLGVMAVATDTRLAVDWPKSSKIVSKSTRSLLMRTGTPYICLLC
ncbi:hypothetical protein EVAR_90362_1 [Eumeta japonica]|uniref:Uncharacterized protein n=1 Tax=Eumeta variegata TaxID=151549 RepID=A0A4C1YBY7_EUMVA|nr:hypothetical protein EVAR_90362_1 [Eumeta japonica]